LTRLETDPRERVGRSGQVHSETTELKINPELLKEKGQRETRVIERGRRVFQTYIGPFPNSSQRGMGVAYVLRDPAYEKRLQSGPKNWSTCFLQEQRKEMWSSGGEENHEGRHGVKKATLAPRVKKIRQP